MAIVVRYFCDECGREVSEYAMVHICSEKEEEKMMTTLDSKYLAVILTTDGYARWAEGRPPEITDVKPEFRAALAGHFIVGAQGR